MRWGVEGDVHTYVCALGVLRGLCEYRQVCAGDVEGDMHIAMGVHWNVEVDVYIARGVC